MERAIEAMSALGFGLFIGYLLKGRGGADIWDDATKAKISGLHPRVRGMGERLILDAQRQGIKLRITSGFRSFEEQERLYQQGRSTPGRVVTNARPGQSWHNYGLAFDVVQIEGGRAMWENPNWPKIGRLGKSSGFEWGGDWRSFKDLPHFEYSPISIAEAKSRHNGNRYINL